jgi:hypothetical protein
MALRQRRAPTPVDHQCSSLRDPLRSTLRAASRIRFVWSDTSICEAGGGGGIRPDDRNRSAHPASLGARARSAMSLFNAVNSESAYRGSRMAASGRAPRRDESPRPPARGVPGSGSLRMDIRIACINKFRCDRAVEVY